MLAKRCLPLVALAMAAFPARALAAPPDVVPPARAVVAAPLGVTMQVISDTLLVLDSNSPTTDGPGHAYFAVRVTNTSGATVSDLRASITLSNGAFLLGGSVPQRQEVYVGTLAAGASRTAYWYIQYPRVNAQQTTATVTVTDALGNTATLAPRLRTYSSISANAGGQIVSVALSGSALGGVSSYDVLYSYGGTSSGDQFQWNPAGNANFAAGCFQLIGARVLTSTVNAIAVGTTDQLTIQASANQGGTDKRINVRYFFRILCANVTTLAEPYASQTSGNTNYKYTGNYGSSASLGNSGFPAALNTFPTSKVASPTSLPTGGQAQFTVSVTNNVSGAIVLDSLVDVLPAGMTYDSVATSSGVKASNSSSLPIAGSTGTIVFRSIPDTATGYRIAPGATLELKYWVTVSSTPGSYTNTVRPYVAGTLVGTGARSASIGVGAAALSVVKTAIAPLTPTTADTLSFEIVTSNAGPDVAAGITLTDTLPAGATFVRATNGGTASSGVVSWATYTLANGATRKDTVQLTMSAAGSITNRARATSSTADGNTADNASGATLTVAAASSDLSITVQRLLADTIVNGSTVRFVVRTTNGGPQASPSTRVAAAIPSIGGNASGTNAPTVTADSVVWTIGTLANGASRADTITFTSLAAGTLRFRAKATTGSVDPTAANDTASDSVVVRQPSANLAVTHTRLGAASVTQGATVQFEIVTTNSGPDAATSLVVRDTLPAGLTFVSSTGATVTGQALSWTASSLASGATRRDTVTVTAASVGTQTAIARAGSAIADPDNSNDRATASVTVTAPVSASADLQVTHTRIGSGTVLTGAAVRFEITTTNAGPDAATSVIVRDTLSADLSYSSATGSPTVSGQVLTWTVGSLAANSTRTDTVTVTAASVGTGTSTARAVAATTDPASGNDRAVASVTIVAPSADLVVTHTRVGADTLVQGTISRLAITITNAGPDAASGVVLRDTLAAGLSFVAATNGGTASGQAVTWNVGTMASGAVRYDTVTVSTVAAGQTVSLAVATSTTADPNTANSRAQASLLVVPPPPAVSDLTVTHTRIGPDSVTQGAAVRFVITTTNLGPDAATGVLVRDTLGTGLTYTSATGTPSVSGSALTWTIGSLASGATRTDTVTVVAAGTGTLAVTARASGANTDPTSANDRAVSSVTSYAPLVVASADVRTEFVRIGSGPVVPGGLIRFEVITTNLGPDAAVGVSVTDSVPTTAALIGATGTPQTTARTLTWPIGSMAAGAVRRDTVTFQLTATGPVRFAGIASASTADPSATNNRAEFTFTVTAPVANVAAAAVLRTPTAPAVSDTVRYVVTVSNAGPDTATAVTGAITLPSGVRFLTASGTSSANASTINWVFGALPPGTTRTDSVFAIIEREGTLNAPFAVTTASSDPVLTDNTNTVTGSAATIDVGLSTRFVGPVIGGTRTTAEFVMKNAGSQLTRGSVVVTDTLIAGLRLPAGVTSAKAGSSGDAVALSVTAAGWVIAPTSTGFTATYDNTVAVGDSLVLRVPLEVIAGATQVSHRAVVQTAGDAVASNNPVALQAATLAVDAALRQQVGALRVGDVTGIRLVATSVGGAATIDTVFVVDTLPAGMTFDRIEGPGWTAVTAGNVVTMRRPASLAVGDSSIVTLFVRIGAAAFPSVTNRAWLTTLGDVAVANNSAVALNVAVEGVPSLRVAIRSLVPRAQILEPVTYEVIVTNDGDTALPAGTLDNVLPLGFSFLSGSATVRGQSVTATGAGRSIVVPLGVIAVGERVTVRYQLRPGPLALEGDRTVRTSAMAVVRSNTAAATVELEAGAFGTEGHIVGRLSLENGDGIPAVRVRLQDGTSTITDESGRYSFAGVRPSLWVVRIDERTLPDAVELRVSSTRDAGSARSRFVDVTAGELARADFVGALRRDAVYSAYEHEVTRRREIAAVPTAGSGRLVDFQRADDPSTRSGLGAGFAVPDTLQRMVASSDRGAGRQARMPGGTAGDTASAAQSSARGMASAETGSSVLQMNPFQLDGLLQLRLTARGSNDAAPDLLRDPMRAILTNDRTSLTGRSAVMASGDVAPGVALTLRYDSNNDPSLRFFRDIRPEELYPLMGDASLRTFGAQSRRGLYAELGGKHWSAAYGDMLVGAGGAAATMLGRYTRSVSGGQLRADGSAGRFGIWGTQDRLRRRVDELPSMGTSGPFTLASSEVMLNSEIVEVVVRDRSQPGLVRSVRRLRRFDDYTLEPLTGRIILRQPLPMSDDGFNPVALRVTYETDTGGEKYTTFGVDGVLHVGAGIEVGGTFAREDDPTQRRDINSANVRVPLGAAAAITGELARSVIGVQEGYARRAEARWTGTDVTFDAQYLRTDSAFVNTAAPVLAGREEAAMHLAAQFGSASTMLFEAQHSKRLDALDRRDGAQITIRQAFTKVIRAELGYRLLEQELRRGTDTLRYGGGGLRARVDLTAPTQRRATVFLEAEKRLGDVDDWRGMFGGEVKLTEKLQGYLRSEFDAGAMGPYEVDPFGRRIATVAGLRSTYGEGQSVFSEYRVRDGLSGREAVAAIGLRNRWRVARGVTVDGSAEREVPVAGSNRVRQFALTSGIAVTRNPNEKVTARLEYREAAGTDLVFGTLGYLRRVSSSTALLGQGNLTVADGGDRVVQRARIGLAHRASSLGGWNGLFRYEQRFDRSQDAAFDVNRMAHTFASNADFRPWSTVQLRLQGVQQFRRDPVQGRVSWGNASLVGARGTWELNNRVDVGSVLRTVRDAGGGGWTLVGGPEAGFTVMKNLRVATGYSVRRIPVDLLLDREPTAKGMYFDIAFKVDEVFLGLGGKK